MRSRRFVLGLLVAGATLLHGACAVHTTTAGVGTLVCVADGDPCSHDAECCSDVCAGSVCATPVAGCLEDNAPCSSPDECCSGICAADGYCGYPDTVIVVTCNEDGLDCAADADCCSFNCNGGICDAPLNACLPDNEPCVDDGDCCSLLCAADGFCGIP